MINLEKELRGIYYTNYFSIFINGNFDGEIEKMSHRDKGTFAHEYLHYLQNIITIYGLRAGIFQFKLLAELKKYIEDNKEITLPIGDKFMSERILKGKEIFDLYNGTEFYKIKELCNYDINIINKGKIKLVEITFLNNRDSDDKIIFGATCVKESMCHYFQSFFDKGELISDIIPYKYAELLVKKFYPEILEDKKKILSILLFSLS